MAVRLWFDSFTMSGLLDLGEMGAPSVGVGRIGSRGTKWGLNFRLRMPSRT